MEKWWSRPTTVAMVAVLVGVAARTWVYAADHALWLDEILLTNGIVGVPLTELLTAPLPYDQVAPRAFLLVERAAVALGGPSEWMLRLFPWLAALGSVVLFRHLAARVASGWTVPLAVLLFALAAPLVGFAGMVKQYASDVAIAIALTLVALQLRTTAMPVRRLVLVGLLGFVAVAFSQAAVPMMAGLGLALAIDWLLTRDRTVARVLMTTIPLWAVASGVAVVIGLRSMTPGTRAYMDRF